MFVFKQISILILLSHIFISPAYSSDSKSTELSSLRESRSICYLKKSAPSLLIKKELIKNTEPEIVSPKLATLLASSKATAKHHVNLSSIDHSIYDVSIDLISDMDYDGFYHYFNITIDVDTLLSRSFIYEDIYLSYEGGPWIYYASSNEYEINSDIYDDAFTLETELASGYPTGYYDLLVKIYDAHTDEFLLSYDSHDDYSLSAIPLEDSQRDEYDYDSGGDTEVIVTHDLGSMGFASLAVFGLIFLGRKLRNKAII
jgi:hypothetical protein